MRKLCLLVLFVSQIALAQSPSQPSPFGAKAGEKLTVTVHPGVELLAIIQYLAGREGPQPSPYLTAVRTHFAPYRNHPAVLFLFNSDVPTGFDLPELGWCFADPMKPSTFTVPDSTYWLKAFSRQELTNYLTLCADFAKKSQFSTFYRQHQADYDRWGKAYRHQVDSLQMVQKLETFFRYPTTSRWYICLDPMNSYGAHAIMTKTLAPAFGQYIVYQQGYWDRQASAKKDLSFDTDITDIYDLVWHEGSHIYISQLRQQYRAQIDSLNHLMPKNDRLAQQNINDWPHFVDESIVRAISLALHREHVGADAAKQRLASEEKNGYVYTDKLASMLQNDYLHTRQYATFDEYFPVLLRNWATLKPVN
jgi:hypothetical protein